MAVFAACIFGLVALRVSGIYFLLITLAMGQLVYGIVHTSVGPLGALTGGSDGLGGVSFPEIMGFSFEAETYYYFTFASFIVCALLLYWITKSPFGYGLARDQGKRNSGPGLWVTIPGSYQYIAFIIGGLFAGIAGALYIYYNGFISPEGVGIGASGAALAHADHWR